jgi:OPA family glycerol-3-phosphate transporter-like MFS transporter/OPA family sugar phosphate sensor protein UhpC-like MFS transporter
VFLFLFWKWPAPPTWLATCLLGASGFFIYGPQALVGIAAANLATNRAAATAVGFTGLFGYASTLLSGWGLGRLVELHGWNAGLGMLVGTGAIGTFLFLLAWPAKAHGYAR